MRSGGCVPAASWRPLSLLRDQDLDFNRYRFSTELYEDITACEQPVQGASPGGHCELPLDTIRWEGSS